MNGRIKLNRRSFLHLSAVTTGIALAACAPAAPQVVEKVVKETVVVEKEVAVREEVVVEKPVVVEKEVPKVIEVEKQVVVEKVITPTPMPAEKVTLRFQSRGGALMDAAPASLERFQAEQPHVTVSYEPMVGNWEQKTLASMVAGTAPDILNAWGFRMYSFYQKRTLLDLGPFVEMEWTTEEIEERFVPAQYKAFWNIAMGAPFLVGLPEYINHMFLHYNKEFFEEAGVDFPDETWTMDDMQEAALTLTKRKPDGTVEHYGGNFPCRGGALSARLFYHIRKWGGHIVNPDDPTDCMLDKPEAQEAMEWLRARIWDDETYNKGLLTGEFFGAALFQGGRAATIHEGLQAGNLATEDDMPWDWDLTHEPLGPVQRSALMTTDGFMVWAETPHPDATWELMKWITGPDWQGMRLEVTGQIPGYRPLVYEYPRLARQKWPRLDGMSLEVIPEALDMGYGSDDERFLKHMEAREIFEPAGEKVFVVGEAPVSHMGDICAEIEPGQKL